MNKEKKENGVSALFFLKCLMASYILTGILLIVLALLLYKAGIGEKIVSISIIAIYVISTLFAGFVAGKRMNSHKFMWGFVMGILYFAVLAVMSLIVNRTMGALGNSFFTTLVLCAAGGTLGGMIG